MLPSPKSQSQTVGFPVDWSWNWTVKGAGPRVLSAMKLTTIIGQVGGQVILQFGQGVGQVVGTVVGGVVGVVEGVVVGTVVGGVVGMMPETEIKFIFIAGSLTPHEFITVRVTV